MLLVRSGAASDMGYVQTYMKRALIPAGVQLAVVLTSLGSDILQLEIHSFDLRVCFRLKGKYARRNVLSSAVTLNPYFLKEGFCLGEVEKYGCLGR